ncbi:MAG TPA: 1-deoxy-D-xylulose-5-phosphate synthase, partial [Rectinemataceae bacterium]
MRRLAKIRSPEDLRGLKERDLRSLAEEIREKIVETISSNGGHLASNLGVIELTIALHTVFESPKDAIVWDVGHQCYTHKLLTGRVDAFSKIRRKGGISGFPKRSESPHDIFETGHSSTALSSALGLLEARSTLGIEGKVVAVVGDGALTAGLAYEALANVVQLGLPLIVVLNDNKMSISRNVGALSRYLSRLTAGMRYQSFRRKFDSMAGNIPRIGPFILDFVVRGKRAVKAIFFKNNFFSDLGFEYIGPIDGHNLVMLTRALGQAKRMEHPVVVHVLTTKGKGNDKAEENPESFHGVAPACADAPSPNQSFTKSFGASLLELAKADPRLVAISAAMVKGTGLETMAKVLPGRVYDVGIAEQHAVTFAAGLATGGLKPVVAIYSTFAQRALDQIIHDVVLPRLGVVFALDRAGAVGEDGETHQGLYDIPLLRGLPGLSVLAPSCEAEMGAFLRAALDRGEPVVLRYPKAEMECSEDFASLPLIWGRGVFARRRQGSRLLVCALGPLVHAAARASDTLARSGLFADVYSLRFASPLDE